MHHLEVPDNPKYKEFAQEIISSIPENVREDEFTRAVAIKLWLDEKMKYTRAVKYVTRPKTLRLLFCLGM